MYIHDPTKLRKTAGIDAVREAMSTANGEFNVNWTTVKDWTPESRYDRALARAAQAAMTAVTC